MLISFETGKQVTSIPHKSDYLRWMRNLQPADYQKISEALNRYIDNKVIAGEPVTAGWIPGPDWTNTVYQPIWIACGRNDIQAGFFFGLIVFETMMKRPEDWFFGKFSKDGREIGSMTYFMKTQGGNK